MNNDIQAIIRSRIPIERLIERDIRLCRCGDRFRGSSPKRPDKDPSLVVYPHNGSWFDFSCGVGGDHINWLEYAHGMGFRDALLELAAMGGFEVPGLDHGAIEKYRESMTVAQIMTEAARYYRAAVLPEIMQQYYVGQYGFTLETVDRLLLGWADGGLWDHLMAQEISPNDAMSTGLFHCRGSDLWTNRLVFPFWQGGLVRYFSARKTHMTPDDPWEDSKYRKLPIKSEKHPYISDAVKNDVFYGDSAGEHVIVTEGITDAIALMQAGFDVISPTTAKFKKDDMPRFVKMTSKTKRITICNDTDEAGIAGARDTALALHQAGRNVWIATLPKPENGEKNDVNQFMRGSDDPRAAFQKILDNAKHVVEYELDRLPSTLPPTEITRALRPVLELVSSADPVARDAYQKVIRDRYKIKASTMKGMICDAETNLEVMDGLKLSTQIVEFIVENAELTHYAGTAYATFGGITENVNGTKFKDRLIMTARKISGQTPGQNPINDAIADIAARARAGAEEPVHVRIAEHDGDIYIDTLIDGQVIHISHDGWRIIDRAPVKFARSPNMLPLTMPERSDEDPIALIRSVFNAKSRGGATLLLGWLLGTLRPQYPVPAMILTGEQGTAKSTAARIARQIIDPSTTPLRSPPRDEETMGIGCDHSYFQVYDNLSRIPTWMSDAICRVVTGGGLSRRKLYTDGDEHISGHMRPVILTSIDELATRGDLAERSVHIELERIPASERITEESLQVKIDQVIPLLLGRILDGAVSGLQNIGKTKLKGSPRMADFATWIAACGEGLGLDGTIYDAFQTALGGADAMVVLSDPVSMAVVKMLQKEEKNTWSGSMSGFAQEIMLHADERSTREKTWPRTARMIGSWHKRHAMILERANIAEIFITRTNSENKVLAQLLDAGKALEVEPSGGKGRE